MLDLLGCFGLLVLPSLFLISAFWCTLTLFSSPHLLVPKPCPSMYLEGAQGACPMHFPYTCALEHSGVFMPQAPPGTLHFVCSPPALQPSRPPEEIHACLCPMVGWTLLGSPDDSTSNVQRSPHDTVFLPDLIKVVGKDWRDATLSEAFLPKV